MAFNSDKQRRVGHGNINQALRLLPAGVAAGYAVLTPMPTRHWRARAKPRYGLNCCGRSVAVMAALVAYSRFTDVEIRPVSETLSIPGEDITDQYLLAARRE